MNMLRLKHHAQAFVATTLLTLFFFIGSSAYILQRQGSLFVDKEPAAVSFPRISSTTPQVLAKAAVVFDPMTGRVLFSKNMSEQLPLASITKLMTAEIVLTEVNPETLVRITAEDLAPSGDLGFKIGDIVPLKDLLAVGLVASSNDAMQAAASSLGTNYVERMNSVAKNMGLTQTFFANPTGLDIDEHTAGAYGSAYDVARLTALFYKQYPLFFELTQRPNASIVVEGRTISASSTDSMLLPISGFKGAKTGYTILAGGNVVALFDIEIGHPVVVVVLGSTREGRFTDALTLINSLRQAQ